MCRRFDFESIQDERECDYWDFYVQKKAIFIAFRRAVCRTAIHSISNSHILLNYYGQ